MDGDSTTSSSRFSRFLHLQQCSSIRSAAAILCFWKQSRDKREVGIEGSQTDPTRGIPTRMVSLRGLSLWSQHCRWASTVLQLRENLLPTEHHTPARQVETLTFQCPCPMICDHFKCHHQWLPKKPKFKTKDPVLALWLRIRNNSKSCKELSN